MAFVTLKSCLFLNTFFRVKNCMIAAFVASPKWVRFCMSREKESPAPTFTVHKRCGMGSGGSWRFIKQMYWWTYLFLVIEASVITSRGSNVLFKIEREGPLFLHIRCGILCWTLYLFNCHFCCDLKYCRTRSGMEPAVALLKVPRIVSGCTIVSILWSVQKRGWVVYTSSSFVEEVRPVTCIVRAE